MSVEQRSKKYLVIIAGPTAVGKTSLSIRLAQFFSTKILSVDSRQFYREMSIGTAKPTEEEMQGVYHYFINNKSIKEDYTAGDYEIDALKILNELFLKHQIVIATGGSGLYVQGLCEGIDFMPDIPKELRSKWMNALEEKGVDTLAQELELVDPEYHASIDIKNPHRVIRGLEMFDLTKRPFSEFRKNTKAERPFEIIKIALNRNREELYERINLRMDQMIEAGLLEEAKSLIEHKNRRSLKTVGYQEIYDYLDGNYDYEEAIRLLKRNSRRYAKRQITWFKRDQEFEWFNPDNFETIKDYVLDKLKD